MSNLKYHLIGNENIIKNHETKTYHRTFKIVCGLTISMFIIFFYIYKSSAPPYMWTIKTGFNTNNSIENVGNNTESSMPKIQDYSSSMDYYTHAWLEMEHTEATLSDIKGLTNIEGYTNTSLSTPPLQMPPDPQKYFVYSATCHMPYIDPFTPDALKIYKPNKYKKCTQDPDLVTSEFDRSKRRYVLHLIGNQTDIHCCYQQILRDGKGNAADKKYKALPCSIFHQDFLVPEQIEAIVVTCKYLSSGKVAQKSAFSFIQVKDHIAERNSTTSNTKDIRVPSVLMMGIDSLSRINFRRTMPLTHKYVNDENWFELQGYNKMGDNTFPNLMAILTGYNNPEAYSKCNPKVAGGLDKCNFTWHNYKKEGYHTAYAEDWVSFSTFNYLKKGFQNPPTDYYLRPLCIAMENMLNVKKEAGIPFCLGQRHYGEYIYDYAMQFANFFEERYFGFFWTNSFSHNDFSKPSSMDVRMLEYFKQMKNDGIFEKAIIIFFSDHGMRFGSLRKLSSGFLEERLPMFYISLPRWFQFAHKDFVEALKLNKNRLTSPYDVHITLNHILELGQPGLKFNKPAACPKCQSIFYKVSENRTCEDAGLTEHWCSCSTYKSVSIKDETVIKVVNMVIDEINKYLSAKKLSSKCLKLKLRAIKSAQQRIPYKNEQKLYYRMKFEAQPKSPTFESTVAYYPKTKNISIDVELISRLDAYKDTSKCIDDKLAKLYCICAK